MSETRRLDLDAIGEVRLCQAIDAAFADPVIRDGFETLVARSPLHAGRTLEAGGCLLLGVALRRLFGGQLVGISERVSGSASRIIEHVVLRPWADRETLLDQRGFWEDENHILEWLADDAEFNRPESEPIDPDVLPGHLLYDEELAELLVARLREALA